jgi:hypothetical protein
MKPILCGTLGLIATVLSYPALADTLPPADKPSAKVGDIFEYEARFVRVPCKRWEVVDTNKGGSIVLQCGDKLAYISADTGNLTKIVGQGGDTLVEFKPFSPGTSFPLEVGKKWEGKYTGYTADDGYRWEGDTRCEVKPPESVKVPAGQFEAYRIDCVDSWELAGASGQAHTSAWYAPKAGTTVKFVHAEDPKWNYQLTGISRK